MWRSFETARMTCASVGRRMYLRATRVTLSSAYARRAGVGSTCRNVTVICISTSRGRTPERTPASRDRLVYLFAPGRWEDAHLLSILRHGAPRDVDLLLPE